MGRTSGSGHRRLVALALILLSGRIAVVAVPTGGSVPAARPPLLLSFAGDLMHHERNAQMPSYDRLYDSVRETLLLDDLSFVNLEFPIDPSQPPAGYPLFNGSVAYLEAAIRAGLDVFALANNHTFDLGLRGARTTREIFSSIDDTHGVAWNGVPHTSGVGILPTTIHHRGWVIGFVSVTAFSNRGGSAPHIHVVDYTNGTLRAAFIDQITQWRSRYDLLVVGVHAGVEYVTQPDPETQAFFRELSDAGADIVWGHHPHVLQPWEERDGRLIMYSTGNFISAQRRYQNPASIWGRWAPTGDTTVYRVRLDWTGDRARVTALSMPSLTMYDHPAHGLVLRTFPEVLAEPLVPAWRNFYERRAEIMEGLLGTGAIPLAPASVVLRDE